MCCSHTGVGASEDQDDFGVGAHLVILGLVSSAPNRKFLEIGDLVKQFRYIECVYRSKSNIEARTTISTFQTGKLLLFINKCPFLPCLRLVEALVIIIPTEIRHIRWSVCRSKLGLVSLNTAHPLAYNYALGTRSFRPPEVRPKQVYSCISPQMTKDTS